MAENEAAVEVPVHQIRRLFVPTDELEWVEVPGWPGVAFGIRVLDKRTVDRYRDAGQVIRIVDGRVQQGQTDVELRSAEANLNLILDCVMDWRGLVVEKPALNSPGETVTEEIRCPSGRDADRARRALLRGLYTGEGSSIRLDNELLEWLVEQCRRVNGLLPETGNS